ncbi:MAG: hypothetical protein IJX22_03155 [Opitutales bacterium]|nr:hypothetical protein [Opitutales bacterium]
MKRIAIYGAGGFGRETACLLREINEITPTWDFVGFFDDGAPAGTRNNQGQILGGMDALNAWNGELAIVFAIAAPKTIEALSGKVSNPNISFPNIVSPTARIMDPATLALGRGNLISHQSVISCDVELGNFNLFNTQIYIGHDSRIGDFNMFNPCVRISGNVTAGSRNFFGVSSVVLQGVSLGNDVTLGANSVLVRTPKDGKTYIGNPATLFDI